MTTAPDQLAAQLALALLLLVLAGLLVTRMLRAIPGAGWITAPAPGRSLLRRAIGLLLLLVLVGLLLNALSGERDGDDGRLPVFVVHTKRTPAIAAHIRAAQAAGKPAILHRVLPTSPDRRPGACRGWRGPGSCDEYPFASTIEGGPGKASIAGVPLWEQRRQGGDQLAFYRRHRIGNGDAFVVVVQFTCSDSSTSPTSPPWSACAKPGCSARPTSRRSNRPGRSPSPNGSATRSTRRNTNRTHNDGASTASRPASAACCAPHCAATWCRFRPPPTSPVSAWKRWKNSPRTGSATASSAAPNFTNMR